MGNKVIERPKKSAIQGLAWQFRSGKSKWGLSKWGLNVLVRNGPQLPTIVVILRRKFPLERGPKRPQKCTSVDDCAQIAESGLKPPFESPHLDFPEFKNYAFLAIQRLSSGPGLAFKKRGVLRLRC